jgi:hypothetical protein
MKCASELSNHARTHPHPEDAAVARLHASVRSVGSDHLLDRRFCGDVQRCGSRPRITRLIQESLDGYAVVHRLTAPLGHCGFGIDYDVHRIVGCEQHGRPST